MSVVASSVSRAPRPSSLADVLDLILDKGLVIDAYVRVSVAGIELLTIDARVVVASVDTYLRFAEAVNRLDLTKTESPGLKGVLGNGRRSGGEDEGDDDSGQEGESKAASRSSRSPASSGEGGPRALGGPLEQRSHRAGGARRQDGGDGPGEDGGDGDDGSEEPGLLGRLAERARFDR